MRAYPPAMRMLVVAPVTIPQAAHITILRVNIVTRVLIMSVPAVTPVMEDSTPAAADIFRVGNVAAVSAVNQSPVAAWQLPAAKILAKEAFVQALQFVAPPVI